MIASVDARAYGTTIHAYANHWHVVLRLSVNYMGRWARQVLCGQSIRLAGPIRHSFTSRLQLDPGALEKCKQRSLVFELVFDELISHLETCHLLSLVSDVRYVLGACTILYRPVRLSMYLTGPLFYSLLWNRRRFSRPPRALPGSQPRDQGI